MLWTQKSEVVQTVKCPSAVVPNIVERCSSNQTCEPDLSVVWRIRYLNQIMSLYFNDQHHLHGSPPTEVKNHLQSLNINLIVQLVMEYDKVLLWFHNAVNWEAFSFLCHLYICLSVRPSSFNKMRAQLTSSLENPAFYPPWSLQDQMTKVSKHINMFLVNCILD